MSDLIGQTLGPYRIIEQIGIGGMATVYKAYQPSMDRYVAIKVLPPLVSRDPAFLKRFRREAQVVAKLEHKHILPVYDYGEQEGLTYLVMRYVEAGTLKDRLAAGQLDLSTIYLIIAQVGAALDYAHRLGVIHRDVKPSNVLIDSQGDAYLTDFGLARIMESSEQLTATGVGVGTPDYMAPEQGQGLKIDHRSDIYSLGVMLYEMATGRVPYQAETPMAVVIKHISAPLPLPSSIKPDIPQQVERVILKAMAKDPDDRFQTVGEMVTALDAAVRLAQVEAPAEVAIGKLAAAKEAAPPRKGFLARAMAGVQKAMQTGWGRTAMWAAVGVVALLAFFFGLSRVPLKVQIRGGQLEVLRVVEATPEAAVSATTPAEAMAAKATETPEPTPARAIATSTSFMIQMRLRVTSTSDWAEVTVVSGETIIHQQAVETGGTTTLAQMHDRTIELDQAIERAAEGHSIYIVQDVTLGGVTEDKEMAFKVEKGCIGVTTVEVFNVATDTPLLVERFSNDTCDKKTFTVRAGVLATASVPATPTPELARPREITPLRPEGGKTVSGCEGMTPPQICVHDVKTGQVTQLTDDLDFKQLGVPSWSPDGQQILFPAGSAQPDHKLYIVNADGSDLRQLTSDDSHDQEAEWSPDGRWIAFYRDCDLWRVRPDGSGEQALLVSDEYCTEVPTWSPDSQKIAFLYFQQGIARGIWVVDADGGNPHQVYALETQKADRGSLSWNPDGGQILAWYWEKGSDEEQRVLIHADGSGVDGTIDGVPYWWGAGYWPRWGMVTPTPTLNPLAEQARTFAEPILAAIADRPPDFVDDFSNPTSGWDIGIVTPSPQRPDEGERGYGSGEYFLTAAPRACNAATHPTLRARSDFVLEVEWRFVSGQTGDWALHFRTWRYDLTNEDGKYAVIVHSDGHIDVIRFESESESLLGSVSSGVKSVTETNSLRIIAVGPEIALYANGEPIFYVSDAGFSDRFRSGDMRFVPCNKKGTIPLRVQFDNLKIWEIADLALPSAEATPAPQPTATPTPRPSLTEQARAFAEPILAAVAGRPPDFQDDFSDPASGWDIGPLQNEWEDGERGYADGEYFIIASPTDGAGGHTCISGTHARQLIFSDFVLDVDGRFISGGVGDWQVQFREWWTGELEGEGKYTAGINADGVTYILRSESGEGFDLAQGLPMKRDFETNSLRIVAIGSQIALYVNGAPALYVNDPGYTERFKAGRTKLLVCHKGVTPLRVHYDNLKIWDISDLASP